ncbi:MAG: choice-of-anchor D domain-containing protein, partial [Jatrophihabitans sp.]
NDDSIQPSMDRTGLHVGFDSYANDFVANDTNITDASGDHVSAQDAFVRTFRPRAALTPVDFGSVKVGLAVGQPATLTVVGFGPFVLDGSAVGGANPGDFSVGDGSCAAQPDHALHFDQTCTIMITFTPATPGPRAGTVSVRGQENPGVTVTVTGIGTRTVAGPAQFGGTPNPVNFGSDIPLRNPGRTKNVTVTNAGGQPLTLTSVDVIDSSVPGARGDYVVDTSDCGAVIAKGTSCVVAVTWSGRAAGPRDAVLRFVDNAPGGVQLIGLRANVPTPVVSANPGVSPGGRVTTITGSGFAPKRNVTVVLENGAEQTSAKTDAKGRFTASLVIFNNTVAGTRIMQASVDGASATLSGEAEMLIVLGTVQSPDFKLRH